MADLGHHDEHAHLAGHGPDLVGHLILLGERLERLRQMRGGGLGGRGGQRAEVHAHEEALGDAVAELLQVEDVVAGAREDARHGVHDAGLVRAGEREDVVGGHGACEAVCSS